MNVRPLELRAMLTRLPPAPEDYYHIQSQDTAVIESPETDP